MQNETTRITDGSDALLRRTETAGALTRAGFPVAAKTLATMATRGGGPTYRTFGRTVLYRWGDALAWAESRLSAPRGSTSGSDVQTQVLQRNCGS